MTSRTTDPATSHLGSAHIAPKRLGLRAAFIQALEAIGPSTANEIARYAVEKGVAANAELVRKWATELVRDGLIKLGPTRVCSVTNQPAGTVELTYGEVEVRNGSAVPDVHRPASPSDSGQRRAPERAGKALRRGTEHDTQHNKRQTLPTPEAERVAAVVQFMRGEREYRAIFAIATEMHHLAKLGTWPAGDSNDYIVAVESAAAQGLIERSGSNVRVKRQEKQPMIKQQGLFDE